MIPPCISRMSPGRRAQSIFCQPGGSSLQQLELWNSHKLKTSQFSDIAGQDTRKQGQNTDAYRQSAVSFALRRALLANSWCHGVSVRTSLTSSCHKLRFLWAVLSGPCRGSKCVFPPLDLILTRSQPAHSENDPPSESTMLSFKIISRRSASSNLTQ